MKDILSQIEANVTQTWSHPNHKFFPGDSAKVKYTYTEESRVLNARIGEVGTVVARSCAKDGTARGPSLKGWYPRCWTRYYVQFEDGNVHGFQSQCLVRVGL